MNSQQHKPKIAKELSCPTLLAERIIKYENTTMYKNNSGFIDKFKVSTFVQSLVINGVIDKK